MIMKAVYYPLAAALLTIFLQTTLGYIGTRSITSHRSSVFNERTTIRANSRQILLRSEVLRELGGYERLLGRKTPGSNQVSLSHSSAFILSSTIDHDALIDAVAHCIKRHPMLSAYIEKREDDRDYWMKHESPDSTSIAAGAVHSLAVSAGSFEDSWQGELQKSINNPEFPNNGPLWRLVNIQSENRGAWVFCFNHAADDQASLNIVVDDLLQYLNAVKGKTPMATPTMLPFPPCIEDAVASGPPGLRTMGWSLFQLLNSAAGPVLYPPRILLKYKIDPLKYKAYADPDQRETFCEFFSLSGEETSRLRSLCRQEGVTITNALAAAVLSLTSAAFQDTDDRPTDSSRMEALNLRFLLSVGLRPFGNVNSPAATAAASAAVTTANGATTTAVVTASASDNGGDFTRGTLACASGAVDYNVKVPASVAGLARGGLEGGAQSKGAMEDFWDVARVCKDKALDIIDNWGFVPESVRLFGLGMKYVDILKVVEIESRNPRSMGRGYSCGVSNVGLVEFTNHHAPDAPDAPDSSAPDQNADAGGSNSKEGVVKVVRGYYGTSHARSGVYALLSCMTVEDTFCGCLQFTQPLISKEDAARFREGLVTLLKELS